MTASQKRCRCSRRPGTIDRFVFPVPAHGERGKRRWIVSLPAATRSASRRRFFNSVGEGIALGGSTEEVDDEAAAAKRTSRRGFRLVEVRPMGGSYAQKAPQSASFLHGCGSHGRADARDRPASAGGRDASQVGAPANGAGCLETRRPVIFPALD